MVKYLLDAGANVNERCCGTFMSPEDQKASRTDNIEHEWVDVNQITNYDGYVYWGEYPLSFAACLGQEECYRLVLARGADPDGQDTNGNTTLHMLVIYEKLDTFDMAYEVGSSLSLRNQLNLTPLTLAAKLGRVEMFFHIMNIEREIYWQLGSITCAAYPLPQIDTIDCETGHISKDSALNLVVFGDKDEHLELLDGILIDLLKTKWNTFVKSRFYRQFCLFTSYFLISLISFLLRPGPMFTTDDNVDENKSNGVDANETISDQHANDRNDPFFLSTIHTVINYTQSTNSHLLQTITNQNIVSTTVSMPFVKQNGEYFSKPFKWKADSNANCILPFQIIRCGLILPNRRISMRFLLGGIRVKSVHFLIWNHIQINYD